MAKIESIYRYPIKGLSPEPLPRATLSPGQTIPGDRLYAIENGPSGFDLAHPYLPKTCFLMLMRNERLAALHTSFNLDTHVLTIETPTLPSRFQGAGLAQCETVSSPGKGEDGARSTPGEGQSLHADLRTAAGRASIETFFAQFCADELRGPPKVLHAEGHSFSDVAKKVVSIINLASVAAVEDMTGAAVDPLRFRANLYVAGWPAWGELDLVGKALTAGRTAHLKGVKRIVRCAATNVDPVTAIRDLNIPQTLMRALGHADCGIYAEVTGAGEIAPGDAIEIV